MLNASAPYMRGHSINEPRAWQIPAARSRNFARGASQRTRCEQGPTTTLRCRRCETTCMRAAGPEVANKPALAWSRSVVQAGMTAVLRSARANPATRRSNSSARRSPSRARKHCRTEVAMSSAYAIAKSCGLRRTLSIKRIAGSIAIAKTDPDAGQHCLMPEVKQKWAGATHQNRTSPQVQAHEAIRARMTVVGIHKSNMT